jgi:NAD(P)H-hydrate epimerase
VKKLNKKFIKSILIERNAFSSKGDYGHALIIAGHKGHMGAAVIAAKAAVRSSLGLLSLNIPEEERFILQTSVPEAMVIAREKKLQNLDKFSSVGIGSGM